MGKQPACFGMPPSTPRSSNWTDSFAIGVNYWASHAGIAMWRDWRPDTVAHDFSLLHSHGVRWLRIFPLWPDFQPIHLLRSAHGQQVEFRHGESELPDRSGVCPVMLDRLTTLADLAEETGLKLVVGLVTGWMSGRLFVPPALEGRNPICDPDALVWEMRLVHRLVEHCRNHSAIYAWDLGNECNVMGPANAAQSWVWTAAIANSIRAADQTRPILSGMHSLDADPSANWSIRVQGELTDVLTTHPYPLFTPHCNREPVGTMRPLLHATAETVLYSDLSGRPAVVEEMGALGPMCASDEITARATYASIFSLWAHGIDALFWWCAYDQTELKSAPYDWISCERELGVLRADGSAKPVLQAMKAAQSAIAEMPILPLPAHTIEAICILTPDQDTWGAAFTCFILAKQAGFDIAFQFADEPLRDAALYLVPSVTGMRGFPRTLQEALESKVRDGATLYMSWNDAFMTHFRELTGLEVLTRSQRHDCCRFRCANHVYEIETGVRWRLKAHGAEVLAKEEDGNPVFSVSGFGRGRVYFLALPLETLLAQRAEVFLPEKCQPWVSLYSIVASEVLSTRALRKGSPWVGMTEHPVGEHTRIAVLINLHSECVDTELTIDPKFGTIDVLLGPKPIDNRLTLDSNAVTILRLRVGNQHAT